MNYKNLIRLINWLIRLANHIKLVKCSEDGNCLCDFCKNKSCKYKATIDKIID